MDRMPYHYGQDALPLWTECLTIMDRMPYQYGQDILHLPLWTLYLISMMKRYGQVFLPLWTGCLTNMDSITYHCGKDMDSFSYHFGQDSVLFWDRLVYHRRKEYWIEYLSFIIDKMCSTVKLPILHGRPTCLL